ncbi:hypothetical protein EDD18DRAFT_1079010, partial [Armillaria luteobubalina]
RIVFKLYDVVVSKMLLNFRELSTGEHHIRRAVMPFSCSKLQFMIQGGDFIAHNGIGGKSLYSEKFKAASLTMYLPWSSYSDCGRDRHSPTWFSLEV